MSETRAEIKIRCFADFTSSKGIHEEYVSKCLNYIAPELTNHYGQNQKYIFTDKDDYTHVFIFNKAMPNIAHIPKQNVIGFAHEPIPFLQLTNEFIYYAQKYISRYYLGDNPGILPEPFQEGNGYLSCYSPPSIPASIAINPSEQKKFMSIMISQKNSAPGHKYRHELAQAILNTKLPIDIYGRGCVYYQSIPDTRIKGSFQSTELYDGYTFTISIENFRSSHYFSEKIINPLNHKITPLYLGCYHIHQYFPEMYIELTGNVREDIQMIENIYKNPENYIRTISLEKVDNTINLIRNLPTFF
jgi:hypothetical protein